MNEEQFTLFNIFPFADPRPDPNRSLSSSGATGNFGIGINVITRRNASVGKAFGDGAAMVVGAEGFVGFGRNSTTMPGIVGTGGIALPMVQAHDRTTFEQTWNGGFFGRLGAVVPIGNAEIMLAGLAGVGWQHVNSTFICTATGACGTNGITPTTLAISTTRPGLLLGFEGGCRPLCCSVSRRRRTTS